jgi:cytochrome c-type biogenesis protein CcmE
MLNQYLMSYTLVENYTQAAELLDKPVKIQGKHALMVMQHMMASPMMVQPDGSFSRLLDFAFDTKAIGQIIVYYKEGILPENMRNNQELMVFGTLHRISGPGKRPNHSSEHSEYYINLDKVELL